MSAEVPKQHVVSTYALQCEGVSKTKVAPLADNPASISLTVYSDGSRDVGCAYLNKVDNTCMSVGKRATNVPCIQLFPGKQELVSATNQPPVIDRTKPKTVDERLIEYLSGKPNTIIPRDEVIKAIWGEEVGGRALENAIGRVRKQVGYNTITTIYGKGIRFNAATEQSPKN